MDASWFHPKCPHALLLPSCPLPSKGRSWSIWSLLNKQANKSSLSVLVHFGARLSAAHRAPSLHPSSEETGLAYSFKDNLSAKVLGKKDEMSIKWFYWTLLTTAVWCFFSAFEQRKKKKVRINAELSLFC